MGDALRRHGVHTLIGIAWAGVAAWLDIRFLWWLLPVVGALSLSIPLSVYTSRVSLGRKLRERGFFLIPEEVNTPREIAATSSYAGNLDATAADDGGSAGSDASEAGRLAPAR